MPHKKLIEILVKMMTKYKFTDEEKAAILDVIGILSWTSLREGAVKAIKEKREKREK